MRNPEKDNEKRSKYREKLLDTAFTLFSEDSIESVKFEEELSQIISSLCQAH